MKLKIDQPAKIQTSALLNGKKNLADLSLDELYFKKIEYRNDILGLGIVMLFASLITIILSIKAKNYGLIVVAILGLQPGLKGLIQLKQVNQEIKSRQAP